MFDADDESSQVSFEPSFGVVMVVVDVVFFRRDAYKMYKKELDTLYALGDPQPEKATKL